MENLYCVICNKYRKFENPKILYLLEKTLVLSLIFNKCQNKNEKLFKEEESIEILKIHNYFKNMSEENKVKNLDQKYRWSKILFNKRNKSK